MDRGILNSTFTFTMKCILFLMIFAQVKGDAHESLAKFSSSGYPFYSIKNPLSTNTGSLEREARYTYEDVVPVVYEFLTPNWTAINLIGYTCTGDDYELDGYSCPVLWYWLTQIRDIIQPEILLSSQRIVDESTFNTRVPCNLIREYFDGNYLSASQRTSFLAFIGTFCNHTEIMLPDGRFKADAIDQPYRKMREEFFEEYYNLQTPVNRSNDFSYTNARYSLYSSGLFNYYIEAQRWSQALSDCKSRRLPISLLKQTDLSIALDAVTRYTVPNGLELVLGREYSRYYKESEIVDCAWTPDSLIVVLQIPTIKTPPVVEQSIVPETIIPVPWKAFSSTMEDGICFLNVEDNTQRENSASALVCNSRGTLCRKSEAETRSTSSMNGNWLRKKSCAEALIQQDADDARFCRVQCEPKSTFKFPLFQKISSDRIVIFGDSFSNVRLNCLNKEQPIDLSEKAVEITVPCSCGVKSGDEFIFQVESLNGDCGDEVHIVPIPRE